MRALHPAFIDRYYTPSTVARCYGAGALQGTMGMEGEGEAADDEPDRVGASKARDERRKLAAPAVRSRQVRRVKTRDLRRGCRRKRVGRSPCAVCVRLLVPWFGARAASQGVLGADEEESGEQTQRLAPEKHLAERAQVA